MLPSDKFSKVLTSAIRQHGLPNRTKASREWFQNQGKAVEFLNKKEFLRDQRGRPSPTPQKGLEPGSLFIFNYDAKWKAELPVWDRYPLVFPFNVQGDRFFALNMHYLPLSQRARLMDALETVKTDNRYDVNTKLKISWQIIKNVAKAEDFQPTVHCYLKRNIKSKLKLILPIEWSYVLFLPLAVGAGQDKDAVAKFMSWQ